MAATTDKKLMSKKIAGRIDIHEDDNGCVKVEPSGARLSLEAGREVTSAVADLGVVTKAEVDKEISIRMVKVFNGTKAEVIKADERIFWTPFNTPTWCPIRG